ncbi:MAG: ribosome small subunit-dependent GTPase A [Candidatus Dormiibacterota bacterium]
MTSTESPSFEPLLALGWGQDFQAAFTALALAEAAPGRVARVDRARCTVLGPEPVRAESGRQVVATGDWVAVGPGTSPGDEPVVLAVLPRRTAFVRDRTGAETAAQIIAANVDRVLLLIGLDVDLSSTRLDRYLTLAWQSGAVPVVVLTKSDTCSAAQADDARRWAEGASVGAEVCVVSAATDAGIGELASNHLAPGRTVALLGPSGVGKSSLVNALAGDELMATGETRRDGKGRHTTTHGQLLLVPGRGILLDTPGMRGLALWNASEGLAQTFADVEELASDCRFSDCQHSGEPGCAVALAISEGRLDPERLTSQRKLQRELDALAIRQGDLLLRHEAQRRWRALSREARRRPK